MRPSVALDVYEFQPIDNLINLDCFSKGFPYTLVFMVSSGYESIMQLNNLIEQPSVVLLS